VHTKGLFEAIEAAALLKAEGVRFRFRIAGSGQDEAALRKLATEHGLDEEIEWLGPVFEEAKKRLWLESDVLVFPTYFEGLPYSLLEAMAAGCVPVICPVGGIPDVMQDGEHGLFVPIGDAAAVAAAIRRLAENRDELLRMSQAGPRRITEQYTVDRIAARFGEIYERVASPQNAAGAVQT
jgi:glycosyltransferase involved in cell wall biosynthesis